MLTTNRREDNGNIVFFSGSTARADYYTYIIILLGKYI